jgi:hypothetical protein
MPFAMDRTKKKEYRLVTLEGVPKGVPKGAPQRIPLYLTC